MNLPTEKDINIFDSLDERWACDHFLGKTLDQAEELFRENSLYYQEALMWMGPKAFCYYIIAAINYIKSDDAARDSEMVSCLLSILESRREELRNELSSSRDSLKDMMDYILENVDKFEFEDGEEEILSRGHSLQKYLKGERMEDCRYSRSGLYESCLAILLSPIIVLFFLLSFLRSLLFHILIWSVWSSRGRKVLFVYSNSPNWKVYVEENIIPQLPNRAIILNWSERSEWPPYSFSRLAFHFFGGRTEFSPMAIVFFPFKASKIFRFFNAFKDYKHGNKDSLILMERDMLNLLNK